MSPRDKLRNYTSIPLSRIRTLCYVFVAWSQWQSHIIWFNIPIGGIGVVSRSNLSLSQALCHLGVVLYDIRMPMTFDICFKQHFDTRYLVFYNPSPPGMFFVPGPSLRISDSTWCHRTPSSSYSTWMLCRGVSGFANDCTCGVWCRGLTTCLLHVGPPFGNRLLSNSWAVGLT